MAYPMYAGYGQVPVSAPPRAVAPPPWVQDPTLQTVLFGLRELGGGVTQELRQLFGVRLDRNEETAWLTFDTPPILVATTAVDVRGTMRVGQESDFVAVGIVAQIVDTAAAPPVLVDPHRIRFRIVDGSTNRQLISLGSTIPMSFISVSEVDAPAGQRPFFLPKPRIFSRNSNVDWFFTNNLAGSIDVRIDVAFFGYRVYDIDALDLTKAR